MLSGNVEGLHAAQSAGAPNPMTPAADSATAETREHWLQASLNSQRPSILLVLEKGDALYLSGRDLEQWRLVLPDGADLDYMGEPYYALSRLGVTSRADLASMTLELEAPPASFVGTRLDQDARSAAPLIEPSPGAFLNYDVSVTRAEERSASAFLEVGAFNGWGSGTSSFVGRHSLDSPSQSYERDPLVRLETTWRRDNPETMHTLQIGDAVTRGSSWGGSVRFGGIQWGTNFETRPDLVTMPLMDLSGEASLPSTVDLYVNDALRGSHEVPPGPFTIDQLPVVTGSGEVRMVVRDILGREQVITRDFYANQRLLRQGLAEYNYSLGWMRESFGLESNDYGTPFASATYATGISNTLTVEAQGQAAPDAQMAGTGAVVALPWSGILHGAVAGSRDEDGFGWLASLGFQRQGERLSFGAEGEVSSDDFTRLGDAATRSRRPRYQWRAYGNWSVGPGSLGLSYTNRTYRDEPPVEIVSAGYSASFGFGYVGVSLLHALDRGGADVNLHVGIPLGRERTSSSFGVSNSGGRSQATAQVQRSAPVGTGYGYRLQAGVGQTDRQHGSVNYQNDHGVWQLESARVEGDTSIRATARGGLAALAGGGVFVSRPITDSFAVVEVPGFPGVRLYSEHQEVARTNQRGRALIPRLRPYQRNRIGIEQADLPLTANIGGTEATLAPYYRSGVVLAFDVHNTVDAWFRVVLEDGEAIPPGAFVEVKGERFPVGMDGEVFLMDIERENVLSVHWQNENCRIPLSVPESDEPLQELGDFLCRGVSR